MDYSCHINVFLFIFEARVAAGGLKAAAACQHGACGAARVLTAPALQRSCFSTSMYRTKTHSMQSEMKLPDSALAGFFCFLLIYRPHHELVN